MVEARKMGIYGEMIAARYLRQHGYEIVSSNFHSRFGEVDLIARKKDTLVFAEVKTRDFSALSSPAEAVNYAKQQKIKKTALFYLSSLDEDVNVRYDVLEVIVKRGVQKKVKVHHIQNAFI